MPLPVSSPVRPAVGSPVFLPTERLLEPIAPFERRQLQGFASTFDRNSSKTGQGFEKLETFGVHVAAQEGLRHEVNLFAGANITDTSSGWSEVGGATISYSASLREFAVVGLSSGSTSVLHADGLGGSILNREARSIAWIRATDAADVGKDIDFRCSRGSAGTFITTVVTITLTAEYVLYATDVLTGTEAAQLNFRMDIVGRTSNSASGCTFKIPTIQEVTGQANQLPISPIPVDTPEGPQIMVNSDFSQGSFGWVADAGVTFVNDLASCDVGAALTILRQDGILIAGRTYVTSYTISNYVAGTCFMALSGASGATQSANGIFEEVLTPTAGNATLFTGPGFEGDIDDFSIRLATTGEQSLDTTNGNTVTDNIVTEAPGVALHPKRPLRLPGYRTIERYTRPDIIKNTQVYAVDDLVHTSAQIFPGCGNGFIYRVTTAGTTDANAVTESDTWTATIGDTVSNNGVVFTNAGHLKYTGMSFAPAGENLVLQSEDQGTTWLNNSNGGVTLTLNDAVAPDGKTTMDKLTGIDGANDGNNQTVTLTAATDYFVSCYFSNVDSGNSRITIFDDNASVALATVRAVWTAGVPSTGSSDAATLIRYDRVPGTDIYRWSFKFTTAGVVTTHAIVLIPDTDNAQKSVHVWGAKIEESLLTPYTKTTTAPVTRVTEADALNYTISQIMHNNAEGFFLVDALMNVDKADLDVVSPNQLLSTLAVGSRGLLLGTSEAFQFTDGTQFPTRDGWVSKNIVYRLGGRWNTDLNELQIFLNDTAGTAVVYDGSFDDDGFWHAFTNVTQLIVSMSNFVYGKKDPGSAAPQAATAYDKAAA